MTERKTQAGEAASRLGRPPELLRWHESLYLRFTVLGLALWLLFALTTVWLPQKTADKGKAEGTSRAIGLAFDLVTQQAQTLAASMVQLSSTPGEGLAGIRSGIPKLIDRDADSALLAAVGIWPLPNTLDPARERASLIWLRDETGTFRLHEDYNDPRTVPYFHEKWFTPSRYSLRDRCYWTAAYQEPLTRLMVSTCTMPIRGPQGFVGAVTVSLNLEAVAKKLALMRSDDSGYSLLVTLAGDVLTPIGSPDDSGDHALRNLAELAREKPSLSPLALRLHEDHQATLHAINLSNEQIAALKQDTRDLSKDEAGAALALLALTPPAGEVKPNYQELSFKSDSALRDAEKVALFSLPGQWWMLIKISPGDFLFGGFDQDFLHDAIPSVVMLIFMLLLLWMLRARIMNPLQQMTEQVAATASARDIPHALDDTARNELGALAYWHNLSLQHLRQQLEQARALRGQPSSDPGDRRGTAEVSLKAHERTGLALQSVADGVIILNEKGFIEDMNLAAERFTGITLRTASGKPFNDIFNARPLQDSKSPLPDLAKIASQQTSPMEYPQSLRLHSAKGGAQEIQLSFFPMQTRLGVSAGCIAVFRKKGPEALAATQVVDSRMLDNMTGMPMRGACENQLRELINQARLVPQQHGLLFIDADDLKGINESKGRQVGDEVITQIGSILSGLAGEENKAYRLYGDQFAIVLQNTDPTRAHAFAESICSRFTSSALRGQAQNFRITVSIGMIMVDGSSPAPSEIIRRSELACTAAKKAGRNRTQEWSPLLEESKQQADDGLWLKRIRAGLEQDMFHLTTQKILPVASRAADGPAFQMLMALEDEEGFWSNAPAYTPTAQRHNLTHELDRWLINRTATQLQLNPAALENISFISIQLSATALSDNGLLEYLMKYFSENAAISTRKFCFSFSEQALQKSPQQTQLFCEVMRNLGCHLCIDGFVGRRTSDIELLRKLPIDFIRIDAMQFPNIEKDSIELMMTESLIRLARTLKKHIIVTNLDSPSQLQAWESLAPDYLQGIAVAKPSPVVFSGG